MGNTSWVMRHGGSEARLTLCLLVELPSVFMEFASTKAHILSTGVLVFSKSP